jgi:hypothetical protein
MIKRLVSTIILILIFIFFDFISFILDIHYDKRPQFSIIYFLFSSVLIFILTENFIYNKLFDLQSGKFRIIIFIIIPLIFSMIVTDRLQEINKFYLFSKRYSKRDYNLYKFDKMLGWKSVPDSKGSFDYFIGDSIKGSVPVIFDSIGFRTVPDSIRLKSNIIDLYLGCSFTLGELLEAQSSFPYLTSKLLKHNYINTGGGGYGLGQMIQLVNSLTKKYRFKYVFIQLSPWLAERAMDINGPTRYVYRPSPYFSDNGSSFKLNPPAYSTLTLSVKDWRVTKPSYYERIQFFLSDGIIAEIFDYYSYQLVKLKSSIGLIPKPTRRKDDLERYFYDYAIEACKKNNTIPIIFKICFPWYSPNQCDNLLKYLRPKAEIIDLDVDLQQKVIESGKKFEQLFYFYLVHRNYTLIFDQHPNKYSNKLFSEKIYNELKSK